MGREFEDGHKHRTSLFDRLRQHWAVERSVWEDAAIQWGLGPPGVAAERIGFGSGPLAWLRARRHRHLRRPVHICLLAPRQRGLPFGPLTAWAINENSQLCTASLNSGLRRADLVWVYVQDPLSARDRGDLERRIARGARPDAHIVNPPHVYNAQHEPGAFGRLAAAGVRVPRDTFGPEDLGRTLVVYKRNGQQGGEKELMPYAGRRNGLTAFEFVDCADMAGFFRRFRAHYFLGLVRPSEAMISRHWNACSKTMVGIEYVFHLTPEEERQIRLIAEVFGLHYFAVDFLRRRSDGAAVFIDVNVYPTIRSPRSRVRARGDYGQWHTFDARRRMALPEPTGEPIWEGFDRCVAAHLAASGREVAAKPVLPWSTTRPLPLGFARTLPDGVLD